jgi:hypothetical protein
VLTRKEALTHIANGGFVICTPHGAAMKEGSGMFIVIILGTGVDRKDAPRIGASTLSGAFREAGKYAERNGYIVVRHNGDDPSRTENRMYVEKFGTR